MGYKPTESEENKCFQCDEIRELKRDVYGYYLCEECIEDNARNGYYDKMD